MRLDEAVRRYLEPSMAPRGFPISEADADAVLLRCDGDLLDPTVDRYAGWREVLERSFAPQPLVCLDLWVHDDADGLRWRFEGFEREVAAAAGADAMTELDEAAAAADTEAYVRQLATVLDAYFATVD